MSYIGNTSTTQAFTPAVDFFNGNGSTTAFTLSRPVASVAQVQAVISNVPQKPGDAFTVSGNTITFTSAPPSGTQNIYVYYTSPITQVIAPGQGTVGTAQIQNGAVIPADLSTGAPAWDANGNMALNGATPSSWRSDFKALDANTTSAFYGRSAFTEVGIASNWFRDSAGNYIYKTSGFAGWYTITEGQHSWYSAPSGTAGNAITFTQVLGVERGRSLALQGASTQAGTGISFPAAQSASTDANTLDDYEEGTWTPTVFTDGGGHSVTYGVQRGTYTKIGRSVSISWYVSWSAFTGGSNGVRVGNLPFTSQSTGPGVYYTGANSEHGTSITYPAGYTTLTYEVAQAATSILPVLNGSGQGTIGLTKTYVGTGSGYMIGSVTYDAA